MKHLFNLILALALVMPTMSAKAQNSSPAVVYLESITGNFKAVKDETWQYLKAITRGKGARKIESKRQALISQLKAAKTDVSKKKDFNGDESLKKSVENYFDISYIVLKEDFDKILDMEDISEQSYDAMEAYMFAKELANKKLEDAFADVQSAERSFCEKNNINLIESEGDKQTQRMIKASKTLAYYNEMYLIFFKVYKQEAYVLDALQRNDISSFDQNNKTLEKEANTALEKLKVQADYEGDKSLILAATEVASFYLRESTKDFATITDFYSKKDAFEKTQKNFDAINKKDRTQADVDQINNASKEYNEAVTKFNKTNEIGNKERNAFLNQWNKKVDSFIDKHGN